MKVKRVIETENGEAIFEAVLGEDELRFIVELGTNVLMANGATLFTTENKENQLIFPDHPIEQ